MRGCSYGVDRMWELGWKVRLGINGNRVRQRYSFLVVDSDQSLVAPSGYPDVSRVGPKSDHLSE